MSDRDEKLNKGELIDIRTLIGDADGGNYSLDDIMAEYGRAAQSAHPKGNVVAFPGPPPPEEPDDPEEPEDRSEASEPMDMSATIRFRRLQKAEAKAKAKAKPEPEPEPDMPEELPEEVPEPEASVSQGTPAEVIPFPKKQNVFAAFVKGLSQKADDYAEHMFEEEESLNKEEVQRLEELIPGTDREEESSAPSRLWRRPQRRQEPPPPDLAPQELARRYTRGLKWMRTRVLLLFLLALLALLQTAVPMLPIEWPEPLGQSEVQALFSAVLLGTGMLLALDLLLVGLFRACRLRFGMDTLALFSCAFTLADAAALALRRTDLADPSHTPYTLVCLAALFFLLHGTYHKRCAMRLSCRCAGSAISPYRVTLEHAVWNDRDTFCKWSGSQENFGSQIQADDGTQRIFRWVCLLLALGCAVCACRAAGQHPERLLWALSALFTASTAFGSTLVYGRPFHKTARRLLPSGAALAGWPGIAASRSGDQVLITDSDLFPPGYVEFNGFKVLGDFSAERVVAYTATLIRDSGSSLGKLFHDQLRSMGGLLRRAQNLEYHEGGGLSATIRGDQVLVGSAAFMRLMDIKLPPGLNVKSAVFCTIDGELAGIFALSYTLPDTVFPALSALVMERVGPVLATRDFNLIPAMLQQRFKLAADKMAFPPIDRRRELSDPSQAHDGTLTALLCREGLLPFAESITAAKRLRWATRLGAALCCAGSFLGLALAAYLTSVGAYSSLSPLHLLLYLLSWLAPVWFLSGWVPRF